LRKVVEKTSSRTAAYSFVTRNYNLRTDIIGLNSNDGIYGEEEAGVGWIPSEKVRMFRNGHKICFEFPVHEVVEPFLKRNSMEIKPCHIPIHHYGQLKEDQRAGKGEEYYRMGKAKLDEMGNEDSTALYELAVQAGMLGKWDEAIALWERLIAAQPHVPLAYVNLGTAFQKTGKYDKALQSVKKAMALDPDMKEASNDYALYLLYQGHAEQAIPVLEDLVERYPEYLSAQFKLAVAYCCDGRKEEGVEVLEKLGRTEMGHSLAESCYGFARKLISFQKSEYAGSVLQAAVASRNGNENVVSLLNECRTGSRIEDFSGHLESMEFPRRN